MMLPLAFAASTFVRCHHDWTDLSVVAGFAPCNGEKGLGVLT